MDIEESPAAVTLHRARNTIAERADSHRRCSLEPKQKAVRDADLALKNAKYAEQQAQDELSKMHTEMRSHEEAYEKLIGQRMKNYSSY